MGKQLIENVLKGKRLERKSLSVTFKHFLLAASYFCHKQTSLRASASFFLKVPDWSTLFPSGWKEIRLEVFKTDLQDFRLETPAIHVLCKVTLSPPLVKSPIIPGFGWKGFSPPVLYYTLFFCWLSRFMNKTCEMCCVFLQHWEVLSGATASSSLPAANWWTVCCCCCCCLEATTESVSHVMAWQHLQLLRNTHACRARQLNDELFLHNLIPLIPL